MAAKNSLRAPLSAGLVRRNSFYALRGKIMIDLKCFV
jgi:hypothetical protein